MATHNHLHSDFQGFGDFKFQPRKKIKKNPNNQASKLQRNLEVYKMNYAYSQTLKLEEKSYVYVFCHIVKLELLEFEDFDI